MPEESVAFPAAVPSPPLASRLAWAALEVMVVSAIFAAAGAWPTPDTNEAHYLTRARHSWDPTWAAGDFFLESPEAHGVFYRLLGPLAATMPLERAAWTGRLAGWVSLAAGFTFAASSVLPTARSRIFAAAVFSLAARHTPAAGEWVIGGCEAKVFSWALVFVAVGWFARGRGADAWAWLGGATALHPLVGGWAMLALLPARLVARSAESGLPLASGWAPATKFVIGLLLAAVGVLPALGLSADADATERARATATYVVERLPHHLLARTFAEGLTARHILAVLLWWMLLPLGDRSAASRRIAAFTLASVGVSLAGGVVSLFEGVAPTVTLGLLRYYWFRLADGIVPLGLALATAGALEARTLARLPAGRLAGVVIAGLLAADLAFESRHWPLPGRVGLVPRADSKVQPEAWREICTWVRDHAPADACFLTPRGASSFHWYTGRKEVVCWKNIPQDARSILDWRQRIIDCFSVDGTVKTLASSTADLGAERLREAARKYGADHIIVPVNRLVPFPLPGEPLHVARGYAVHRIEPPPTLDGEPVP